MPAFSFMFVEEVGPGADLKHGEFGVSVGRSSDRGGGVAAIAGEEKGN